MVLFFDLDGPILDVSPRYVRLHRDLLDRYGFEGAYSGKYWQRKRAVVPEPDILAELGWSHIAPMYLTERQRLIESREYLELDRPWPWAAATLERLRSVAPLVLVTARSRRDLLLEQLDRMGLRQYFTTILSEAAGADVAAQKARLMRDYLEGDTNGHWMVGDTEADVEAGRCLGFTTAAVLSGIRDEDRLRAARPDFLLNDIRELSVGVVATRRGSS